MQYLQQVQQGEIAMFAALSKFFRRTQKPLTAEETLIEEVRQKLVVSGNVHSPEVVRLKVEPRFTEMHEDQDIGLLVGILVLLIGVIVLFIVNSAWIGVKRESLARPMYQYQQQHRYQYQEPDLVPFIPEKRVKRVEV